MSDFYHTGLAAGLLLGLLAGGLILRLLFKRRVLDCTFDERQELARGVAYKYGFITLLVSIFAYGMLELVVGRWCDALAGAALCFAPGLCVFAVTCIRRDAYLSLRESPRKVMVLFALIALFNLVLGGISLASGELVVDGLLTFRAANPILGLAILVILAVYLGNRLLGAREEDSEGGA